MSERLTLVSHKLCPYVQRAAIALSEKNVPFERIDVDLSDKPAWFRRLSPLGRTPVLIVGEMPIFESAVILEYIEDTQPPALHPRDPLARAEHRAWIEFSGAILNDIAGFYNAADDEALAGKASAIRSKFQRVEDRLDGSPYFAGDRFSLVDAVFGPVFRYFDTFERIGDFAFFPGMAKLAGWRTRIADRPSVQNAVGADYPMLLRQFIARRNSQLSRILADTAVPA